MPCSRSPGGWYPSMPCRFPGPHPRGKFSGIWSRPTAEGDLVQAHSQGEVEGDLLWGVPAPGGAALGGVPVPWGCLLWVCVCGDPP